MCKLRFFADQTMQKGEVIRCRQGKMSIFSQRAPGSSHANEDAAAVLELPGNSVILVIADGVGGGRSGEKASLAAIEVLGAAVAAYSNNNNGNGKQGGLRSAILDGFERANRQVIDFGIGAATTLLVVEIEKSVMRCYHVGDSMALVMGNRGKIRYQTLPHSPVGYAVEAGYLDEQEAIHHKDRHIISNYVGSEEMRIEVGAPIKLKPLDTLVLGSDGLFDNLHAAEIVRFCRKGPLRKAAGALSSLCLQRMTAPQGEAPSKPDDLTFIVYRTVSMPR